jgi:PAS domain-containing protein
MLVGTRTGPHDRFDPSDGWDARSAPGGQPDRRPGGQGTVGHADRPGRGALVWAMAIDPLYQGIVDNARVATGARMVHFAWYDPATGMVQTGAWSGAGTAPVHHALAAARRALPAFDVLHVRFAADVNPFNRRVFVDGEAVEGPFADAVAGTVPPAAAAAATRVAGLRYTFSCPLLVRGAVAGTLAYHTSAPLQPAQRATCEAFARQAALTLENARLHEQAERARAELEAFVDAAADAVLVFAVGGRLVRANRAAREWFGLLLDEADAPAEEPRPSGRPAWPAGAAPVAVVLERALQGRRVSQEVAWPAPGRPARRLHVVAVPVNDAAGRPWATVLIARDITELHAAIAAQGRLDGAIKTARLVAHQLNNQLAPIQGYGELLVEELEGEPAALAGRIVHGARASAATVARLQRIIRFEETATAGFQMLDLDAATRPSD